MRLGISVGGPRRGERSLAADVRFVQAAEALGVDYAWSAEAWGRDAVTPIAYLAGQTRTIRLGTGIMQVTARVPAMIAMTALSLADLTGGRFVLGLGVSGPQVVEGLHGVPFNPALTRLKETVAIVRKALAGEKLQFDGQVFQLPRPGGQGKALRIDQPPQPELPIYLATLGPRALAYTGEVADGWLGTSFSPDFAAAHFDHLAQGARRRGRSLGDLDLQVVANVAIGDDVEHAVTQLKPGVAFTLGAMGSAQTNFYNAAFRRAGFEDAALAVQRLWLDGQREAAAAAVPDELVLKYGLIGTEEMVRERLAVYREAGVTCINLRFPPLDGAAREAALERAVSVLRAQ